MNFNYIGGRWFAVAHSAPVYGSGPTKDDAEIQCSQHLVWYERGQTSRKRVRK